MLGRRAGARSLLLGGLIATLPDLDVFVPLGDPVSNFTYHRSASHSIFVLTLLTPLLTWLLLRRYPEQRPHARTWAGAVWLILITHVLLDCFTIYGTQILWPLWPEPVAWGSLFIIDPLYTLPLLVAVIGGLCLRREPMRLWRWSLWGLALSSAYLAFSLGAKLVVERAVAGTLERQGMAHQPFMTVPTAFNTVLWRTVVMTEQGYLEGYFSLLDPSPSVRLRAYASAPELLEPVRDAWAVRRLAWFTHGFYRVRDERGQVVITDLRMGQEPFYVFSFVVAERRDGEIVALPNRRYPLPRPEPRQLMEIWHRILTGPDYDMRFAEGP